MIKEKKKKIHDAPTPAHSGRVRSLGAHREFVIDNLLVRFRFVVVMIRWTGLASWEFEFPFPSTFLCRSGVRALGAQGHGSGFQV